MPTGDDTGQPTTGAAHRGRAVSEWYLRAAVVVAVVYLFVPRVPAKLGLWPLIGWSSVVAIVVGVRRHRPRARAAWYLLAGGVAALIIGDDLYSVRILVQHHTDAPFPSLIDIAYLAMYPMLVAGLALLVHHRSVKRDRTVALDAGIITTGLGLVWWTAFLAPYYRDEHLGALERVVSIAYPLGDIVILATAVRLTIAGGRRPRAFWLLAVGLAGLFVADALFGFLALDGVFLEHSPADIGWAIFYITWGAAALDPTMATLSEKIERRPELSPARLAVIGSAVLIPPIMLFAESALGNVADATPIAITGAVLLTLVLIRIVGIVREAAEARTETRMRALIDKSSDAILVIDGEARIRYHSFAAEKVFGRTAAELTGSRLTELLRDADAQRLRVLLATRTTSANFDWRLRHGTGGWRDLEVVVDDLRDTAGVDGIVLTIRDVTKRNQLNSELRRQALHDSLTGLPNRVLFVDRVDQAMRRIGRRSNSVAVLFVDLDDFKVVNDSLGHTFGDELLVAVAARLLTSVRTGDSLARLGGDEFGFLLENGDVEQGAEAAAQRIHDVLHAPFVVAGRQMHIGASIGIAIGMSSSHSPDDLLRDAEVAMYAAKRKGKSRFELFRPEMHDDANRRLEVAAELLGGLERNELVVHYQPIVEIDSGRIVGAEALVRWQHPQRGLLAPNEFIPVAEDTGLIATLDRWVLGEACRQVATWRRTDQCTDGFYVSVNMSARHLRDSRIGVDIKQALDSAGLPASALVLEVTETALIDDLDSASAVLAHLKQIGVRIAVDDFGTGYSSLSHLLTFPIDIIKIDKSFVDRLLSRTGDEVMVRAVLDMATTLGLDPIAEGVERAEQAAALDALHCRLAQGYLYARPAPPEDLAVLLATQPLGVRREPVT